MGKKIGYIMDIHSLRHHLMIPIVIIGSILIYIFIYKNEPLQAEVSRSIEESTQWTTTKKLEDPSLFLYTVQQKLEEAIQSQKTSVYELEKSGEILNDKLRASIARQEFIDQKLHNLKDDYILLQNKLTYNPENYGYQVEISNKKNEITGLLLEKDAVANSIARTKKQVNMNIEHAQIAGLKSIKLQSDLSLVQTTDDLAKVLNPSTGLGLTAEGQSELAGLLADVNTLSRYLERQTDNYIASDLPVVNYTNTDEIFEIFMNSEEESSENTQDIDVFEDTNT